MTRYRLWWPLLILSLLLAAPGTISSQAMSELVGEPYLVTETYPGPNPEGDPLHGPCGYSWQLGDALMVPVYHAVDHHTDLWRTDGTAAGTYEIHFDDLTYSTFLACAGPERYPSSLLREDLMFLGIKDENHDEVLFVSDGTQQGTTRLAGPFEDIREQIGEAYGPSETVWFETYPSVRGVARDLWITDGTLSGTRPVELDEPDVWTSLAGSIGSDLIFSRWVSWNTDDSRYQLWRGDGSFEGSSLFYEESVSRLFSLPPLEDGQFLFQTHEYLDSETRIRILTTDGTPGSEKIVVELPEPTHEPGTFYRVGGRLLWSQNAIAGNASVWATDGTQAGTIRLLPKEPTDVIQRLQSFTGIDDRFVLFLLVSEAAPDQYSLYSSDGTVGGTHELLRCPASSCFHYFFTYPFGDDVMVQWRGSAPSLALVTDGTPKGTWQIPTACSPGPDESLTGQEIGGLPVFAFWTTNSKNSHNRLRICLKAEDKADFEVALETEISYPYHVNFLGNRILFTRNTPALGNELWAIDLKTPAEASCTSDNHSLCLLEERFRVTGRWRKPVTGETGVATAKPFPGSDRTGAFWFFKEENIELLVKAIDGTSVNGKQWLFYGALSDVEYWIDVVDTKTGASKTYHNPPGEFCGYGDTAAFDSILTEPTHVERFETNRATRDSCGAGEALCLRDDRFQVEVAWKVDDREGVGHPVEGTDETGFFWFFKPDNLELAVKVLDGRSINGSFWVYFAGLSDTEYAVTVRDTLTGQEKTFSNPAGTLCGQTHLDAFQ